MLPVDQRCHVSVGFGFRSLYFLRCYVSCYRYMSPENYRNPVLTALNYRNREFLAASLLLEMSVSCVEFYTPDF